MSFFRDYFLPRGERVTFWGPYNRALIPLFAAVTPLLVLQLATGLQLIPSTYFWIALAIGAFISAYVFLIGAIPWIYKTVQYGRKRGGKG